MNNQYCIHLKYNLYWINMHFIPMFSIKSCLNINAINVLSHIHACMLSSLQSCLFHDPMDCNLLGFSVHGISQARILQWVAMPSSWGSYPPRDWSCSSCIAGGFFTTEPPGKLPKLYPLDTFHSCLLLLPFCLFSFFAFSFLSSLLCSFQVLCLVLTML